MEQCFESAIIKLLEILAEMNGLKVLVILKQLT